MTALCCNAARAYKNTRTDHEEKFRSFLSWSAQLGLRGIGAKQEMETTQDPEVGLDGNDTDRAAEANVLLDDTTPSFIIQLVEQINYGRIVSKKYYASLCEDGTTGFCEVNETFLIQNNFEKLNTYKNYKCLTHNLFFELNVYRKDPFNKHHWHSNVARPSGDIDL